MLVDLDACSDGDFSHLAILRSVIIGLSEFSSIAEMMKFVENCRSSDPKEIPSLTSSISKYRAFFKLTTVVPDAEFPKLCTIAFNLFHATNSSKLGTKIKTESKRRFLAYLIVHHTCVLRTNQFGGISDTDNAKSDFEMSLRLVSSYLNHSCCPNVAIIKKDNLAICISVLPIRRGEQLFISYIDEEDDEYKRKVNRQIYLKNVYGFDCKCTICENGLVSTFE